MKIRWPRRRTLLWLTLGTCVILVAAAFGGFHYLKAQFLREQPNRLNFVGDLHAVPFRWSATRYEDYVEPHSAMLVKVSIPGHPTPFHMQFDTGSPYTFLRSGAVEAMRAHGLLPDALQSDEEAPAEDFEIEVGTNRIRFPRGHVRGRAATIDWDDPEAINLIGTIGSDFIDQKVCAIDFSSQTIHLFASRPDSLNALGTFTPFSFRGRRVVLPVQIDGVDQYVFYDSGCSAFGLFTSKYHFDRHARAEATRVSYNASRHGDPIPIHHQATDAVAQFGEAQIPLGRVSYVDQYGGLQSGLGWLMKGGVLGNKCLTGCTLVLDTKVGEFLVALAPIDASTAAATDPAVVAASARSPQPSVGNPLR